MDRVVDFGEFRIKFAERKRQEQKKLCLHKRIEVDELSKQVICIECEEAIDPFAALLNIVHNWESAQHWRKVQEERIAQLQSKAAHLIAARHIEEVWRGKRAPLCPHCRTAILPEDTKTMTQTVSIGTEMLRRQKQKEIKNG